MLSNSVLMEVARVISRSATCPRLQSAAVLVSPDRRIVATGYNGAPRNFPHCVEEGCIIEGGHCVRAVHAELNAILQCASGGVLTRACTLYCLHRPCVRCAVALVQAKLSGVVWESPYDSDGLGPEVLRIFEQGGVCAYYMERGGKLVSAL